VIHRDIKPSNILVDGSGNPQLLDFGLARLAGDYSEDRLHLTEAGEVMGTPSYMSPEQTLGRPEEIDIRSDVYSIGVLFYELITDALPYRVDRSRPLEALRTVRDYVPPRPSEINPKVDGDLESVVMKCLEKERDMRYQSAVELAEDIGRYLRGQPVEARPSTSFYHLRKLMWRHRSVFLPIGIGLLVVLVVTAAVIGYLAHEREQAEHIASAALDDRRELVEFLLSLEAVRSGIDNLMAQGRWEEAYRAATFAEEQLPEEAGLTGYADAVRRRIAEATASEADQIGRLIDRLRFRDARERIRHLRQLAQRVGLPELAAQMDTAAEEFDEDCWGSAVSYMQRNGGAVRVLEKFLGECPNSPRVTEARYILRSKLKSIQYSDWPFVPREARRRQEETARVLDVPFERQWQLDGNAALRLVLIPAGEFVMGAPEEGQGFNEDQKPPHRVRIPSPFYMTATEVTRKQFEAVTGRTPPAPEAMGEGVDAGDLPAAASWKDANLFCTELARRRQLTVRLPTEAEWEYACRGGSEGACGAVGSSTGLLDRAWCRENSGQRPHVVGQKDANAWGLYDLYGNMLEWCQDWYDSRYYLSSPVDDPRGPENGTYKVLRGGSWSDAVQELNAVARRAVPPDSEGPTYGFRVCVEVFTEQPQPAAAQAVLPASLP
jgi:formylglycine-generating enzyme required for sulfatase activity